MKCRTVFVLLFAAAGLSVGCQSAFRRNPAYGRHAPASSRPNRSAANVLFSDECRPVADRPDVGVRFECDVQRPADVELARFVDVCLDETYRHARGEERRGVSTTGAREVRDAFFADYREWFDESWSSVTNGELPTAVARWSCRIEGRIVFCDGEHFSYRVILDTETGGIHPNRWVQNATYSRAERRPLTVADVVKADGMTPVLNLIRRALRDGANGDARLVASLQDEIRSTYDEYDRDIRGGRRDQWGNPLVTDNFMIVGDGLVWTYNQQEIACYDSGWFDARVPWREIEPHLRIRRHQASSRPPVAEPRP